MFMCPSFYNLLFEHVCTCSQCIYTVWNCGTILSKNNNLYVYRHFTREKITVSLNRLLYIYSVFCTVSVTEYTECQAFFPVVRFVSLLPSLSPRGRHIFACGGGGGTQFRRRNRHSGTLCILQYNPSTVSAVVSDSNANRQIKPRWTELPLILISKLSKDSIKSK